MESYLISLYQKISPGLQKIVNNFSWLLAERLLTMMIALTIGIYSIRYLGVRDFGLLSYVISFVGIFDVIARLGLDSIVVRNLVREDSLSNQLLGTSWVLKIISIATIGLISILSFSIFSDNQQTKWLMIIVVFSLIFNAFDVIDFWFQAKLLSQSMVIVRTIQITINSIIKLIFIHFKLSVFAFAFLFIIDGFIKTVGMIIAYRQQKYSLSQWRFSLPLAKKLLSDSWPLILSSVMVIIYVRIDQVMLGIMADEKAVGIYAAAIRFSEIWYFIPVIICSSVFPAILKAKIQSQSLYNQRLQQLYDLLTWISLTIGLCVCLSAYPAVNFLLGQAYHQSATILILHIWALPFVFLGVGRNQLLVAENLTHFSFWTTALGAISNILLNLILIPTYQGIGAAIATVISYGIAAYFSCLLYRPIYPTFWMLTKALLIPFRVQQNLIYLRQIKKLLG